MFRYLILICIGVAIKGSTAGLQWMQIPPDLSAQLAFALSDKDFFWRLRGETKVDLVYDSRGRLLSMQNLLPAAPGWRKAKYLSEQGACCI